MWVSQSPDLVFWGKSRPLMYKGDVFRDGHKFGAGAVPIKTDRGWLEIYHTVSQTWWASKNSCPMCSWPSGPGWLPLWSALDG